MGLNDPYFTLDGDDSEANVEKVKLSVFKDGSNGDAPELKDDVQFIVIPQEPIDTDEMTAKTAAALENACVRMRDLELLTQHIAAAGGMSQQIAVESLHLVPSFITDEHPKQFYTESPTRTSLNYALEEVSNEKQGLVAKIKEAFKGFLDRAINWFKNFISKFNGKNAAKAQQEKDAAVAKEREAQEAKIAGLKEEIDQLRRAAAASDEEFAEQVKKRDSEISGLKDKVADNENTIASLQSQMRVLDDTKNREIAAALDQIDKLRKSAETSRANRLALAEQVEKLEVTVYRAMVRSAFDLVQEQSNDIVKDYHSFVTNKLATHLFIAKYMFGNGFQNRMQTIKRVTDAILATNALVPHLNKLIAGFENSVNDPASLVAAIDEIDFAHFTSPDQVFQKTSGFEEVAKNITFKQLNEASVQMRNEFTRISSALGDVKLEEMLKSLQKLSDDVGKVQIPSSLQNITEVVNSHRKLQACLAKMLPLFNKGAMASYEMSAAWLQLNVVQPNVTYYAQKNSECLARVKAICDAVARSISVTESFAAAKLKKHVIDIIITKLDEEVKK